MSDKTLDEVSKEIGISKSTTFLAVKKTKLHLKNNIQNPFENDK
jgi:predicted DNA binding protein